MERKGIHDRPTSWCGQRSQPLSVRFCVEDNGNIRFIRGRRRLLLTTTRGCAGRYSTSQDQYSTFVWIYLPGTTTEEERGTASLRVSTSRFCHERERVREGEKEGGSEGEHQQKAKVKGLHGHKVSFGAAVCVLGLLEVKGYRSHEYVC